MAAKRRKRKLPRGVCRSAKGKFIKCSVKRARKRSKRRK